MSYLSGKLGCAKFSHPNKTLHYMGISGLNTSKVLLSAFFWVSILCWASHLVGISMQRIGRAIALSFLMAASGWAIAQERLSSDVQELMVKAKSGDAQAQFRLGTAYDYGRGAPRDGKEAMRWYLTSAEQGNAEAQNSVGSGLQAEKRYAEALPWYERSVAQGHALATNNLAYLYDLGLGVTQDRKRGFELYSKAADLGWAEAMWNLTNIYGAGQLGKPDLVMACAWAVRARRFARSGEQELLSYISRTMPRLERVLSREQLASCKEQGESWAPTAAAPKIE